MELDSEKKKNTTKYKERIVAFVDILGFSSMVKESETNQEQYEKLKNALDTIQRVKKFSDNTKAKVTTFSDSVVISYSTDNKDPLFYILIDLIHLQLDLLQQGILVRGGIAKGKVRHVEEMVFGPAMVAAYELEDKYAVYPRIIVESDVVEWERENYRRQVYGANSDINDLESLIRKDEYNDIYYIDILRQTNELDYFEDVEALFFKVYSTIEEGLKCRDKYVRMKYIWLKNYFNDVVSSNYPRLIKLLIV